MQIPFKLWRTKDSYDFISNVLAFQANSLPFTKTLRSRLTTNGDDELAQSLETKKREKKRRKMRGVNDRSPSRELLITNEAVKPLRRGNRRSFEAV